MKPFKVERTPESSPDVGRKHNFWRSLISDLIYKKKIRELVYNPLRVVLKAVLFVSYILCHTREVM